MRNEKLKTDALSYAAASARLQEIVTKIEDAEVGVDELENLVNEAVSLVGVCRAKLRGTQTAVETALAGMAAQTPAAASASPPALFSDAPGAKREEDDPFADE